MGLVGVGEWAGGDTDSAMYVEAAHLPQEGMTELRCIQTELFKHQLGLSSASTQELGSGPAQTQARTLIRLPPSLTRLAEQLGLPERVVRHALEQTLGEIRQELCAPVIEAETKMAWGSQCNLVTFAVATEEGKGVGAGGAR